MNTFNKFIKIKGIRISLIILIVTSTIQMLSFNLIPAYILHLIETNTIYLRLLITVGVFAAVMVGVNIIKQQSENKIAVSLLKFRLRTKLEIMRFQTKLGYEQYIQSSKLDQFQKLNSFFETNEYGFEKVVYDVVELLFSIGTLLVLTIILRVYLSLFAITLVVLYAVLVNSLFNYLEKKKRQEDIQSSKLGRKSNYYFDSFFENSSLETTKYLGEEQKLKKLLVDSENERKIYEQQKYKYEFWTSILSDTSVYIFAGLLIMYLISNNSYDLAMLWIVIYSGIQYFQLLNKIIQKLAYIRSTKEYDQLFIEMFNSSYKQEKSSIDNSDISSIEFKNVSYHYPADSKLVISNLNMKLTSGEKYAIIGENGVGKSTIVDLMLGFLKPTSGQILINGIDITNYTRDELNTMYSTVFQEVNMYPTSLNNNLSMSTAAVNSKFIEDNLRYFELLEKYGSDLSIQLTKEIVEDGVNLSGGEIQQLSILKTLYENNQILIFDEPTSALDAKAELHYYQLINQLAKSKIMVLITHRMAGCRFVDQIIYIENGNVAECGGHQQLISKNGKYANFYNKQADSYLEVDDE